MGNGEEQGVERVEKYYVDVKTQNIASLKTFRLTSERREDLPDGRERMEMRRKKCREQACLFLFNLFHTSINFALNNLHNPNCLS